MTIFLAWLALSFAVAIAASRKGRNGAGWLVLSLVISPLLAVCFLLAVGPKPVKVLELQPQIDWSKVDWAGKGQVIEQTKPGPSVAAVVLLTTLGTVAFIMLMMLLAATVGGS